LKLRGVALEVPATGNGAGILDRQLAIINPELKVPLKAKQKGKGKRSAF